MGLGKQAKTLNNNQQKAILHYLSSTRSPDRNKVIFLLSLKAGLRAKEISQLTWRMVTTSEGEIADCISLTNKASKGSSGGVVWLNKELSVALNLLWQQNWQTDKNMFVIKSERRSHLSAQAIVNMFANWYKQMEFEGCSSHSGRRTFITNAARKISTVGGSIRDVQMLARHSSLLMTQRYIESDIDAMKKVVDLV